MEKTILLSDEIQWSGGQWWFCNMQRAVSTNNVCSDRTAAHRPAVEKQDEDKIWIHQFGRNHMKANRQGLCPSTNTNTLMFICRMGHGVVFIPLVESSIEGVFSSTVGFLPSTRRLCLSSRPCLPTPPTILPS